MKTLLVFLGLGAAWPALAALQIFATVPEWGALAKEIGGDQVRVYTATHALQDPHRIEAKPSLLAQARRAQLLIATGADLEVGWLPLVQRESGNAAIQTGRSGYFEAASVVAMLDVPAVVDRAHGDVHPGGNPHIQLDPHRVLLVAAALSERMAAVDPDNANHYRTNHRRFAEQWQNAIARWEKLAQPLRGVPVVVQHASFTYLLDWLGMKQVATLEPKPGIEPGSAHLGEVLTRLQQQPARMVLRAAYQHEGPSQWLASKSGLPVVVLPFTVGASPASGNLFALFDATLQDLLKALKP